MLSLCDWSQNDPQGQCNKGYTMTEHDIGIIPRIRAALDTGQSRRHVARTLKIVPMHVTRALNEGYVSPTLYRAAVAAGWVNHEPRRRFAADVDDFTMVRITALRDCFEMGNGELLRWLLDVADER